MKHQHETGAARREPWPRKLVAAVCALGLALLSVPLGVFHAPEVAMADTPPKLAQTNTWYKSAIDKSTFTTINIVDSFSPAGDEIESWDASSSQDGSVTAYVSADGTTLTIAGNGSGSIKTCSDSGYAFAEFSAVTAINGIELLDVSSTSYFNNMFENCQSLTSLNLDSWNVSNASSFRYTFNNCYALTSLGPSNLGSWVTGSVSTFFGTFHNCKSLTAIDVSNWDLSSCWNIDDMFAYCEKLTEINVSNWDVSYVSHFIGTFDSCESLQSIDVSQWVTSRAKYMSSLFYGCKSLTTIDVSGFDTSSCEAINLMFAGCENLQSIDVTHFSTEKVTTFQGVFDGCSSLTTIDVSTWDTGEGLDLSHLFSGCVGLTSIDLDNFVTTKCTDMACMFDGCTGLSAIDLSGFDTSSVTSLTWMFRNCSSMTSLDLSTFNTSACTNLVGTFTGCTRLEALDISSWNTSSAKYMSNLFANMPVLQQVTLGADFSFTGNGSTSCVLPTPDPAYITGATGKWQAVGSGTVTEPAGTVYLPADVPSNVAETYVIEREAPLAIPMLAANTTWYAQGGTTIDKSTFTTINIVDSYSATGSETASWDASAALDGSVMAYVSADGTTLTIAGNGYGKIFANTDSKFAFQNFSAAASISGTELLDVSGTTDLSYMFDGCSALTSLNVDGWNVSAATTLAAMFKNCSSIVSLGTNNLANWQLTSATNLGNMFDGCSSLLALDVSNWDVSGVGSFLSMFEDCSSLTTLDVSRWNTSSATSFIWTFSGCSGLATIDVSGWDSTHVTRMVGMFESCSSLASVDLSSFNTDACTDFDSLFYYCTSLGTIIGLDHINTTGCTTLEHVFNGCSSLTSLDLSSWDVSNVTSFVDLFNSCSSLTSLNLSGWTASPNHTTRMFKGCSSLPVLDISGINTSDASGMSNMFLGMNKLQQVSLGSNFTFTGNGSTSCVLPTPDPTYIPGANGKWQAVGTGTVIAPAGTIYDPADVPSFVAETYVMPLVGVDIDVPIKVILALDANGNICTPTATENKIINHTIVGAKVVSAVAEAQGSFQLLQQDALSTTTQDNAFGGSITAGNGAASDLSSISTTGNNWKMAAGSATDASNQIALQLSGAIKNVSSGLLAAPAYVFGITYTFDLDI